MDRFPKHSGLWKHACAVLVTVLTSTALLMGAFWMLIALVMFQNFHLPNLWHDFVLLHTFLSPLANLVACVYYHFRGSWRTALISVGCSLSTLAS